MTTTEERRELLQMARDTHAALQEHNKLVHRLTAKLIAVSDEMKLQSADEISAGTEVTKRAITYARQNAQSVERMAADAVAGTGKRACGLCHKPGHRAPNCPEAHLIHAEKQAAIAARDARAAKPKRVVSPERRAQLAKALEKARAMKKAVPGTHAPKHKK